MKQPKAQSSKTNKPKKVSSSIIYSGPSLIDGKPIVCIAIKGSKNSKTGGLIQTYILRADIDPREASKHGLDYSICGDCIHRGIADPTGPGKLAKGRSCYVNLSQGPTTVYKAFKRSKYPIANPDAIKAIGAGKMVRLGTYGDPAAVPSSVWDNLLADSVGHTGYTHQTGKLAVDSARLMISADNENQAKDAHSKGQRTFRVIPIGQWKAKGKESLLHNEILCPASKEAGAKVQCIDCKLCAGSSIKAKSIAIPAHGTGRNMVKG